ncbi:MAG TPA: penicillin-binding transpeptidase domain-containing protein [Pyrinomonadaceae bacterium]|nr:penicillin-binding transpeptidase domain-containing protein [Pyrinomonadaceae bacterium]
MNNQLLRQIAVAVLLLIAAAQLVDAASKAKNAKATRNDKITTTAKKASSKDRSSSKPEPNARNSKNKKAETAARPPSAKEIPARNAKSAKREAIARESLAKRQRAAELRRAEERRRAEAARLAAIERQRAKDEALRDHVQQLIAKDDLTGEDPEIRRIAVNALGRHAGTVVVMNPQTGRVYSIVNQEWGLREGFKPCSTIKLVTSIAGLNEDVIDPNDTTKVSDSNQVTLTRALAYSKNQYFQIVGEQVGLDKMLTYSRRMGLGEKTGINARNEFQGRVPGTESFRAIHRISSHGDHYEVTPLQLATLTSAIGNGGKLMTPYIVRSRSDEMKMKAKVRRQINVDREVWNQLTPGLVGAVNYGSGKRAQDPDQQVAGKTGTCIEDGRWVGLFASYAPVVNPKLAVVVIARGPDARSHFPAAVAGRIYREMGNRHGTPAVQHVAAAREVNSLVSEEEEETVLEEEAEYKVEPTTVFQRDGKSSKVKPVLMSIPMPRVVKPQVSDSSLGGQTRPRRVLGE